MRGGWWLEPTTCASPGEGRPCCPIVTHTLPFPHRHSVSFRSSPKGQSHSRNPRKYPGGLGAAPGQWNHREPRTLSPCPAAWSGTAVAPVPALTHRWPGSCWTHAASLLINPQRQGDTRRAAPRPGRHPSPRGGHPRCWARRLEKRRPQGCFKQNKLFTGAAAGVWRREV